MPNKRKRYLALTAVLAAAAGGSYALRPSPGVVEKYEDEVEHAQTDRERGEQARLDARMLGNILVEVDAIEAAMREMNETHLVERNENEGLYTVEQEEDIAEAYSRYLYLRKGLFHIAFRHKDYAQLSGRAADESFLLAYGAGLALYRNAVLFVIFFKDQPNARRKLNEADPVRGIPAGMFEEMFGNITSRDNVNLVLDGVDEFEARRASLAELSVMQTPELAGLLERLDGYERELGQAYTSLAEGKRDVLWNRIKSRVTKPAYKAQSFISVMVSHIRTPLHAPGLTPQSIARDIRPKLQAGDILFTRRDGYLSNTFLPGNWGHAALYLGSREELLALGDNAELDALLREVGYAGDDRDGYPYAAIEAIGEGVRLSSLEFALHANLVAVLRPRLDNAQKQAAAIAALKLNGTPYDFAFDIFSQDKIICTELVYRAYAPHLEVEFEEVMGRKTLKPDGMLRSLSPAASEACTELVLFGESVDGDLRPSSLDALMSTVP